jgi:transposase
MIDVEEFLTLRDLFNKELSISEIARQPGHSRVTVRKYLSSQIPPLPKKRLRKPSKLDGHREYKHLELGVGLNLKCEGRGGQQNSLPAPPVQ